MNTFFRFIFLYIPALFGWIIGIITMLTLFGVINHPMVQDNEFNPDDYQPITSYEKDGTTITIHAKP